MRSKHSEYANKKQHAAREKLQSDEILDRKKIVTALVTICTDQKNTLPNICLVITALLMLVQTIFTQKQLSELKSQQRPWISAEITNPNDLAFDPKKLDVRLNLLVKNSGITPALGITSFVKTFEIPAGEPLFNRDTIIAQCADFDRDVPSHLVGGQGFTLFKELSRADTYSFKLRENEFKKPSNNLYVVICTRYDFSTIQGHGLTSDYYLVIPQLNPPRIWLEHGGSYAK